MLRMLILVTSFVLLAVPANAAPRFEARATDGTVIVLYDEPCAFAHVLSQGRRASWKEPQGKSYEGCWIPDAQFPLIVMWFEDKTLVLVPRQQFQPLRTS